MGPEDSREKPSEFRHDVNKRQNMKIEVQLFHVSLDQRLAVRSDNDNSYLDHKYPRFLSYKGGSNEHHNALIFL